MEKLSKLNKRKYNKLKKIFHTRRHNDNNNKFVDKNFFDHIPHSGDGEIRGPVLKDR